MSLPAAAAPVAVLVLAWDEATPAVRALVEATEIAEPLLDSVVVLVPAGPANGETLTLEEFFPIAPQPEALAALPHPAPTAAPLPAPAPEELPPLPLAAELPAPQLAERSAPIELVKAGMSSPVTAPQRAASEAAVRVLHLSNFSLPALAVLASQALPRPIWSGKATLPAAPYVGRAEVTSADENASFLNQLPANQYNSSSELTNPLASSPSSLPPSLATEPPALSAASASFNYLPGEFPALDVEADAASMLLSEEVDLPEAEAPLAAAFAAVQAGWPEALASLRAPLSLEEPELLADLEDEAVYYAEVARGGEKYEAPLAPLAPLMPSALRPASQTFGAPNLNFQVIQYARFAVPVALAEAPFAAIYAPAWPTWLAAQELRQRTGRPLVLHVATLAASEAESVETATGWQAEIQRQALHRADLILTETPALARRLRQDLGLSPTLVRTVPAADAAAIAQALHTAQPRPIVNAG